MKYAFFEGEIVNENAAKISIKTNSFNYGTAVFEGIKAYWYEEQKQMYVLHMKEHYERLLKSCSLLKLKVPHSVQEMCTITLDLIKRNAPTQDIYIRPIAYFSTEAIGPRLIGYETQLAIYTIPLDKYLNTDDGIKVCTSSWIKVNDNMIPPRCKISGAYVNSALAKTEALENGYDEAIMLTSAGYIAEGSSANIFLVRDGVLITPDPSQDLLEGITRKAIITIAKDELQLEVVERPVNRTELYVADEIFFCGTAAQVCPILEVDKRPIRNGEIGPITHKLQELYFDIILSKNDRYAHWCTPVY